MSVLLGSEVVARHTKSAGEGGRFLAHPFTMLATSLASL
jgi:hypothetical protein